MPIAQIHIVEGRTREEKRRLIQEVTNAMQRTLDAPLDSIRVLLYEVSKENWGIAGVSKADAESP